MNGWMTKPNAVDYLIFTALLGVAVLVADAIAYQRGYQTRDAEQVESDKRVAQQMADVGFCAWLENQQTMMTECAARRTRR